MSGIARLKRMLQSSVLQNYSHMTVAQIMSAVVSLCIYPYVIRCLGGEEYGWYVFGLSIVNYFVDFVDFGITMPAVKSIVECRDSKDSINKVVSSIYLIKCILALLSVAVFVVLLLLIETLRERAVILSVVFMQIISEAIIPRWFYQARQKMQYITYASVGCRILSIPFVFLYVKSEDDLVIFAITQSLSVIIGAIIPMTIMFVKDKVHLVAVTGDDVKQMLRSGFPFLASGVIGTIKSETVTVFIGAFFGMRDVAIYDLANKVVSIPRMFTQNINKAIYPSVLAGNTRERIKKIIRREYIIGGAVMVAVAIAGYWAVLILGGSEMMGAYPVAVVLSLSILTCLVVGAYLSFVFIPNNRYYLVTVNQTVALVSFVIVALLLYRVCPDVKSIVVALVMSGVFEIINCVYFTSKYKLL